MLSEKDGWRVHHITDPKVALTTHAFLPLSAQAGRGNEGEG